MRDNDYSEDDLALDAGCGLFFALLLSVFLWAIIGLVIWIA